LAALRQVWRPLPADLVSLAIVGHGSIVTATASAAAFSGGSMETQPDRQAVIVIGARAQRSSA
jgi:hypothetical protein